MKNIWLSSALLMISFAAVAADPPLDCTRYNPQDYAHCTHFVDSLPDPMTEGYMMLLSYTWNGTTVMEEEMCLNSNYQLDFKMSNAPGTYVVAFKMGYRDINGNIFYQDYASQTFQHTGEGQANPNIFEVVINPNIPTTCE